jgi:hypothetical protein
MDELLKMLEGFIQSANSGQAKQKTNQNWKYCVILVAQGWSAGECKKISGTNDKKRREGHSHKAFTL